MSIKYVILQTVTWLLCLVSAAYSADRPNIIIILADDLGWNDVSFHGSNQIPTPNIDALAYNGIILNSHYVPALCTPSRASLLTGKYPTSIGMQHMVLLSAEPRGLPLEETLMPEHFKRHGYSTHAIGKWHLGFHKKEYTPTYRGFDTHFGYWNGYQDYYDHIMDETVVTFRGYDMRRGMEVDYASQGKYSTDAFTEEAVNIIQNHNSSESPLFLYLAHLAPHTGNDDKPFQAPDEEIAKHAHIKDPERRVYAAMVTKMDEGIGRVVAALREADMLENSIILFMADNGAVTFGVHSNHGSNYPLRGLKESPWEGGVRGAAAIWSPLLNQTRRVSNQMMHTSDWLPTLYTAAGFDVSELGSIDGKDVWHSLTNDLESPRMEVFNNYDEIEGYSSLRVGSWKYIEGTAQEGAVDEWYGESGEDAVHLGYDTSKVLNSKAGIAINGYLTNIQLQNYGNPDKIVPEIISPGMILQLRQNAVVTCDQTFSWLSTLTKNDTERSGKYLKKRSPLKEKTIDDSVMRKLKEIDEKVRDGLKEISKELFGENNAMERNIIVGNEADSIFSCNPLKEVCLFNLEKDPCERINLAKVFPDVLNVMKTRLIELKKTVVKPANVPCDPLANPSLHNGSWTNWNDMDTRSSAWEDMILLMFDNIILKIVFSPILLAVHWIIELTKTLLSFLSFILLGVAFAHLFSSTRKLSLDEKNEKRTTHETPQNKSSPNNNVCDETN